MRICFVRKPVVKVSVIIPVYNAEQYLRQCLDSVVKQTLKDIEIICINDGSTDNSINILREYEKKLNHIFVVDQENSGAGYSRNKGIELSRGKYLSFLDADDFFEPDMLEKAYLKAEEHDAQICVFKADLYESREKKYYSCENAFKEQFIPEFLPFSSVDIKDDIFRCFRGWAWDKLFLREFIVEQDIRFQELRTTNDMYFVFYALVKAHKITVVPKIFAHQRINIAQSLSSTREKSWDCFYHALLFLKNKLESDGIYEQYRRAYVNWALELSLWHLYSIHVSKFINICELLKEKGFLALDIIGHEDEYYYDKREYDLLKKILGDTKENLTINILVEQVEYLEDKLTHANNVIQSKDNIITKKNNIIAQKNNRINDIYNSTSYKLGNTVVRMPSKIKNKIKNIR